jgi:outer membrane protein OmpA-like peptidoglycan-associated protein
MGSPRRNQQLSEQRARSVRSFLVAQGIAPNLLVSKGYGQDNPLADNGTVAGRAKNRRVELHQITAE